MTLEEVAVKLAEVEQRSKSNTKRLNKQEDQTDAIQRLATAIELMVQKQEHQTETIERIEKNVEKLDGKVEVLEHKPAKRWESVVNKIITALVGALIGCLMVKLGLG